jgi:CheY-like chemotaxis protein
MAGEINCILLIDDNHDDNFFHERIIRKSEIAKTIIVKETAQEALDYLKSKKDNEGELPNLIFLDINMPGMNGWEFLTEYARLDLSPQKRTIITMLSTSDTREDKVKALTFKNVSDYRTKPLTVEMLKEVAARYFNKAT